MAKWEYCEVGCGYNDTDILYFRPSGTEVVTIKREKNEKVSSGRTIAKLGLEGWELVAVNGASNAPILYFKRPIAG